MAIFVFFAVVFAFALALNIIDKIRSYKKRENRSVWVDGDSIVVKPRDAEGVGGGFATRIDVETETKKTA